MFRFLRPAGLRAFVGQYAIERGLTAPSLQAIFYVVNSFEKSLGRPATLSDFECGRVNAWLNSLLRAGLDAETIRNRRTVILGLWRHAHDAHLVKRRPERIAKIKVPDKPPVCWHLDSVRLLLAVVGRLTGCMNSARTIKRAAFWRAYILVAYDLGVRLGDLRRLAFTDIDRDGQVVLVQHKTKRVLAGQLGVEARLAVAQIRGDRRLVFGDVVNQANAQRYFRKLVKLAGLKGSTKWIRRTGATWVEVHNPGSAPAYLGHSDRRTAYRSYVDQRWIQAHKPRPPRIG